MTARADSPAPRRTTAAALGDLPGRIAALGKWLWLAAVVGFILAPDVVIIGASFDPGRVVAQRAFLQFPPTGFTLDWYRHIQPSLWEALWTSMKLAAVVALCATALGLPTAIGLVRGHYPGRALIASLLRAPLQIPFIVTGIAFLQAYFALAKLGGLSLQGSFTGLVLAHLFVATPYLIGATGAALQQISPKLEEAAQSLGASAPRAFCRVVLPLIAPGIFGGALYAFLISFTDVTIALFLTPQGATTLPVWVFSSVQNDLDPTVPAMSSLVFVGSIVAILLLQRLIGMDTVLKSGGAKG